MSVVFNYEPIDYPVWVVCFSAGGNSHNFVMANLGEGGQGSQMTPCGGSGALAGSTDPDTLALMDAVADFLASATWGGDSISNVAFYVYNESVTSVTP